MGFIPGPLPVALVVPTGNNFSLSRSEIPVSRDKRFLGCLMPITSRHRNNLLLR
jgi:hypothetical protein